MSPILEVEGLRKAYLKGSVEVEALRGLDLAIDEGRFIAIMGPSGSGKSTLPHILGALDRPTSGVVRFRGRTISGWGEEPEASLFRRQHVGFVFQSLNLVQHLTAEENVILPGPAHQSTRNGGTCETMKRSATLVVAVLVALAAGLLAGRWSASVALQNRVNPDIIYGNLHYHLRENEKILAGSAASGTQKAGQTSVFEASGLLGEAYRFSSILEVQLRAVYDDPPTYLLSRVQWLNDAARALTEANLCGQQVSVEDVETLRLGVERLLQDLPDPDEADLVTLRGRLGALEPADPSLLSLMDRCP